MLNGLRLGIESAAINAYLYSDVADAGVCWSLDVRCKEHVFPDATDAPCFAPCFFTDVLPLSVPDWSAIAGSRLHFDLETDPGEDGGPTLYLCDYEPLRESDIRIGQRHDNRFDLEWSGRADANFDETYGSNMPFCIRGQAEFGQLEVRFWSEPGQQDGFETAAKALLDAHGLRHDNLTYDGMRRFRDDPDNPNYGLIRCFFTPSRSSGQQQLSPAPTFHIH
ncbi:hypothetical protein CSC70_03790 [Pseudoxanthomonas kalamensis DSM 18571]|uniref:hypothetical protein n=1 Tax=Pseudoxanthomonas kalamensis TaxID=289483 RepID=UPI001B860EA9|nr:hypothetical protein [Pseudoxanthomonas kalamensis]KAF1712631.1 hypothetical protein CSC70_03790 [Pseudoxanthomonas kalamensis DSM 18571]